MVDILKRIFNPSEYCCFCGLCVTARIKLEQLARFGWIIAILVSAIWTFSRGDAGGKSLLTELKQRGYKLAVISNGGHATRLNILQGLGFSHYFDEIVSSGLLGISKPNPEIFYIPAINWVFLHNIVFMLVIIRGMIYKVQPMLEWRRFGWKVFMMLVNIAR